MTAKYHAGTSYTPEQRDQLDAAYHEWILADMTADYYGYDNEEKNERANAFFTEYEALHVKFSASNATAPEFEGKPTFAEWSAYYGLVNEDAVTATEFGAEAPYLAGGKVIRRTSTPTAVETFYRVGDETFYEFDSKLEAPEDSYRVSKVEEPLATVHWRLSNGKTGHGEPIPLSLAIAWRDDMLDDPLLDGDEYWIEEVQA